MKPSNLKSRYQGLSYAEAAEAIDKKYKSRDINSIQERSFKYEMTELDKLQAQARAVEAATNQLKCGGKMKHQFGEPIENPNFNPDQLISPAYYHSAAGVDTFATGDNELNPMVRELGADDSSYRSLVDRERGLIQHPFGVAGKDADLMKMQPLSKVQAEQDAEFADIKSRVLDSGEAPVEETDKDGFSSFTPAFIGQGLSTLINAGILAGGYDKETPAYNPYESEIRNKLRDTDVDRQQLRNQILSSFNAARARVTGSPQVRQAMLANLAATEGGAIADAELRAEQLDRQSMFRGVGVLDALGRERMTADFQAKELTARNKGVWQSELSKMGVSLADTGKFVTKMQMNKDMNMVMADILDQKYSDFGLNMDVMGRIMNGTWTPGDKAIMVKAYGKGKAEKVIKKFEEVYEEVEAENTPTRKES